MSLKNIVLPFLLCAFVCGVLHAGDNEKWEDPSCGEAPPCAPRKPPKTPAPASYSRMSEVLQEFDLDTPSAHTTQTADESGRPAKKAAVSKTDGVADVFPHYVAWLEKLTGEGRMEDAAFDLYGPQAIDEFIKPLPDGRLMDMFCHGVRVYDIAARHLLKPSPQQREHIEILTSYQSQSKNVIHLDVPRPERDDETATLVDLSALACLPVTEVSLAPAGPINVRNISSLGVFHNIHTLDLDRCFEVEDISFLSHMNLLENLKIAGFGLLEDISVIKQLPRLRVFKLSYCDRLIDISPILACENLEELHLTGCGAKVHKSFETQKELDAYEEKLYQDARGIVRMSKLRVLEFADYPGCHMAATLALDLPNIEELHLREWGGLRSVLNLSTCEKLRVCHFSNCVNFQTTIGLEQCEELRDVCLYGTKVQTLRPLMALPNLKTCSIGECETIPESEKLELAAILASRGGSLDDEG